MTIGKLRLVALIASLLAILWCFVFLAVLTQPLDESDIAGSDAASVSERLFESEAARVRSSGLQQGAVSTGWAEACITPSPGVPTYGYSARLGRGITRVADSVFVRAVAIQVGAAAPIVFISADICTWVGPISGKIVSELTHIVPSENLYLAVTHTHSGPGGYAKGRIDRWIMGGEDDDQCRLLISQSIRVARAAVDDLERGEYRELARELPQYLLNRVQPEDPVDDEIVVLEFRKKDGDSFALVFFGAHATTLNSHATVCSGDYPAAMSRSLVRQGYASVMFIAAATAQAGPALDGKRVSEAGTSLAEKYGEILADEVLALSHTSHTPFVDTTVTAGFMTAISLPRYQYRMMGRVLTPAVTEWLLGSTAQSVLQGIRIGETVYVGHSFEFSAVLARQMKADARREGYRLVVTGFNRDNFLYVVPPEYYHKSTYESSLSLFGPTLGTYLKEASRKVSSLLIAIRQPPPSGQDRQ